jgi:hypothetical protein
MTKINIFTDDELSGIGIGPEHGVAMARINELITEVDDRDIKATCTGLNLKTDESEVSAALDGVSTKKFYPTGVLVYVTAADTATGDATINVGITTGGAEIAAAAIVALTAVGEYLFIPAILACKTIAGNATVYVNVESIDSGTGITVSAIVMGRQF